MNDSIKKIVLEVGGVELALSPEDARKLHAALGELFGVQQRPIIKEYVPYPVYIWLLSVFGLYTLPVRLK